MIRKIVVLAILALASMAPSFAKLMELDLDAVATRLGEASGSHFAVEIDGTDELNAWASSDGRVGVTQGMLDALQTQDQLAFVIGHERSHLSKSHHKKQLGQSLLGAVLGNLAGRAIGKDSDAANLGAEIGAGILGGKASRSDEYEADFEGMKLAVKAGFSPNGAIETLQLLQSRYGDGEAGIPVIGWFASHPDTGNRVEALRTEIRKLAPSKKPVKSNLETIEDALKSIERAKPGFPAPRSKKMKKTEAPPAPAGWASFMSKKTIKKTPNPGRGDLWTGQSSS